MYVVKETACLSPADRSAVDEELAADTGTFVGAGTRTVIAAVRAAAIRRDPRSVAQRASHAASERRVSLRPAPDCMTYLTALLPVHEGVAVLRGADPARRLPPRRRRPALARPDQSRHPGRVDHRHPRRHHRHRAQRRHDRPHPPPGRQQNPPGSPATAPFPADWARNLVATEQAKGVEELKTWVRRLYTAPGTGDLVAMDSRRRALPGTPAPLHPDPRRHLPDTLLRRPDPPPRPHYPVARRRPHHAGQRRRTMRSLQPHQRTPRLESPTQTGSEAHHRTDNTHRPQLPVHGTATAWFQADRVRLNETNLAGTPVNESHNAKAPAPPLIRQDRVDGWARRCSRSTSYLTTRARPAGPWPSAPR